LEQKFIDVEKIIGDKNPALLKRLPGFLLNYLKRILHQDEVNRILYENRDLLGSDFCDDILERFAIEVTPKGIAHVPKSGGVILACNHPLGGMDAMAVSHLMAHHRKDFKFIVNDILMELPNLRGIFTGVNKHGANAASSLKKVDELFGSSEAVFVYPAGLVSRRRNGEVQDLEWKKTFVTRAKKYGTPIIPVHISGRLSGFFYNLANIRERLGIKTNIEMLYLVNEQFKLKAKPISVTFGKLIEPASLTNDKTDLEWAQEIKYQVYQLAD
jgi:putative hemolysin